MPELPEVEVLVRHLRPLLVGQTVRTVSVSRSKVLGRTSVSELERALVGAAFHDVKRRGKYLVFEMTRRNHGDSRLVVGHLGMTGRMYLLPSHQSLPRHTPVVLGLGADNFVFEDTRYFGRFTLDTEAVDRLGPEPLDRAFTAQALSAVLERSRQPIKIKLLDQSILAGIGNIYASEILFAAGISPFKSACRLRSDEVWRLLKAIRHVLGQAIRCGSTVPLSFGPAGRDRLFYFGRADGAPDYYEERLQVYDREGQSCYCCGRPVERSVQAGRSTYFCRNCQPRSGSKCKPLRQ